MQRLGTEQVVEQLGRSEDGPHPLQRLAHLGCATKPLTDLVRLDGDPGAVGEGGEDRCLDVTATGVVGAEASCRVGNDGAGLPD